MNKNYVAFLILFGNVYQPHKLDVFYGVPSLQYIFLPKRSNNYFLKLLLDK